MKVKWGKELYSDVDLNTDDEPVLFKAQLQSLTGVQPHRQKIMIKGAVIKVSFHTKLIIIELEFTTLFFSSRTILGRMWPAK